MARISGHRGYRVGDNPVKSNTVLFVDDEANILKALKRLLRNEPYEVLTATCAAEALEQFQRSEIQVVVSDQRMPEMSGADFLSRLREKYPETIRMMLTGHTEMDTAVEAINRGEIFRLITKPWKEDVLKTSLRQALDHFEMKHEIKRLNQVSREQNFKLQDMNRNLEAKVRERTQQLGQKNRELRKGYIETIRALAEAVDAKDAYTRGHSERVAVYASRLARELNLEKTMIERVYFSGLLHDVGKIGIPDAIIAKPARLNEEEYREIKRHPEIGAKILEPVEMLSKIAPCVRHHHEWFDGSTRGYPDRLRGEQIPLPSRIILVADTVEAMTSDRPYRKGLPMTVVIDELRKYSGRQFDPKIVDAFMRLLEQQGDEFISKDEKFDIDAFIDA